MTKVSCSRCGFTLAEQAGNVVILGRKGDKAEIVGAQSIVRECRNCGHSNKLVLDRNVEVCAK